MMEQTIVQIQVQGWIGELWEDWFDDMTLTHGHAQDDSPVTTLIGPVADQAALRSLLVRIWDLNLTVISVNRVTSMFCE